MNWTEGSLARHSRGRQRNALVARQKQHFAKARSGLLGPRPKGGPVSISFLPSDVHPEPTSHSSRPVSDPRSYDDLPSTPPLPPSSREARQQPPIGIPGDGGQDLATSFNRRKRLLERSDWAGLKLQEPLNISFPGQIYATKRWAGLAYPRDSPPYESPKHLVAPDEHQQKALKRSSMKIQIGSQEIHPSIETSPQASTKRYTREVEALAHRGPQSWEAGRSVHSSGCREYEYLNVGSVDTFQTLPRYSGVGEPPVNVVCSAPALIEPTPIRHLYSQTQQWFSPSSEDGESMQVEIERPIQLVPRSQKSDNKKWKDWVIGEQSSDFLSDSIMTTRASSETDNQNSGSSVVTLPPHFRSQLPSFHLLSEPEVAPRYTSPEHSSARLQDPTDSETAHESPDPRQAGEASVETCSNPPPSTEQRIPTKKNDSADDLNEQWRKFACGEDEDSDELMKNAYKEAMHQAVEELRPLDTSDSADVGTETVATCGTDLSSAEHLPDQSSHSPEGYLSIERTVCSESAPSAVATVGSSIEPPTKPANFVLPKAFVGKYVNSGETSMVRHFNEDSAGDGKRGIRKRRKKMATDGRTDIRSLPNFDGDPIEEIED